MEPRTVAEQELFCVPLSAGAGSRRNRTGRAASVIGLAARDPLRSAVIIPPDDAPKHFAARMPSMSAIAPVAASGRLLGPLQASATKRRARRCVAEPTDLGLPTGLMVANGFCGV